MIRRFDEIGEATSFGGKALGLARLVRAGHPVPAGFAIDADSLDDRDGILAAYRELGFGRVAVRSSAIGEDGQESSFAGQQETILNVEGDDDLIAAVGRCRASVDGERAVAYRRERGLHGVRMAIVVQRMVEATAAGVLFTVDPLDATGQRLSIEAAWGLGEVVVSGRVTPDRFVVERTTRRIVERSAGQKEIELTSTGERAVEPERRAKLCMTDGQVSQLAELGLRIETADGEPRDIEWAFENEVLFLLQSRPITANPASELEAIRQSEIAAAKALATEPTVWVRYNLSESLPEPTQMTWGIVRRMLAQDGGFGALNRDLGADPDPALGSLGAFDLIAGRPMANLARMPRMQFRRSPFEYPLAEYERHPERTIDPQPVMNPLRGGLKAIFGLPAMMGAMSRFAKAVAKEAETFPQRFASEIAPAFAAKARAAFATDWTKSSTPELLQAFEHWWTATTVDFARQSLKPTAFADAAWSEAKALLIPVLGPDRTRDCLAEAVQGAKPADEASVSTGLLQLGDRRLSLEEFLLRFGHRGSNEMELAEPRWSERPDDVVAIAKAMPLERPATNVSAIIERYRVPKSLIAKAESRIDRLRNFIGLRETGKHWLLLGFAVLRRLLLEFDRRNGLNGGVFFLEPSELASLDGATRKIADRKKERRLKLRLQVPAVLSSNDLEAIGRTFPPPAGAGVLKGLPVSAGVAEGPALVLTSPVAPPCEAFVLVCPSTDPGWVPLFAQAKGAVLESGGVLSHGAIVAREFGLPAVSGLPGATRAIRTGQRIRVDGTSGTVTLLD